jgi:hypothetical protein
MTSASQSRSRMQAATDWSVAWMRALSLKAGMTMLYCGYCVTRAATACRGSGLKGKTLDMIAPLDGVAALNLRPGPFSAGLAMGKYGFFARRASFSRS